MDQIDIAIIGAGAVGLAIAAEIGARHPEAATILFERHGQFGQDTSSRNSEVIHAGMYYPTGSLKAKLCVEGNPLLYEFCEKHGVPYQRIGKVIIARDQTEIPSLEKILDQGQANGVQGLRMIDADEVKRLEPNVSAVAALFSENTGIIDSHKLMFQLEHMAGKNNVMLAYKHEVINVVPEGEGFVITFKGPDEETDQIFCRWLINSAGLYADKIAGMCGIDTEAAGYTIYPVKGEYFSVSMSKSNMVSHLVYPPPLHGLKGLGTHITKSLDGRGRLGPNAHYVTEREDYDVDPEHLEEFYQAAITYLPFIERSDLAQDMAGMRPKIQAPDAPVADFKICRESERGLPTLINLVGIESPGLTSCLAIAKYAADLCVFEDK